MRWVFEWINDESSSSWTSLKCFQVSNSCLMDLRCPFSAGIVWPQASQTCCDNRLAVAFVSEMFMIGTVLFSVVKYWYYFLSKYITKRNPFFHYVDYFSGICQFGVNMFTFFEPRKLLWTRRMQQCQLYRKSFAQNPKTFCSEFKKDILKSNFFEKKQGSPKMFLWTRTKLFRQPWRKNFAQSLKIICSKYNKKTSSFDFFSMFPQKCSPEHLKAVLRTLPKFFWSNSAIFCTTSEKSFKIFRKKVS